MLVRPFSKVLREDYVDRIGQGPRGAAFVWSSTMHFAASKNALARVISENTLSRHTLPGGAFTGR